MIGAHADIYVMNGYHTFLGHVGVIRMTLVLSVLIFCITLDSNGMGGNAYRRDVSYLFRNASPIDCVPRPALEKNLGHLLFWAVANRPISG